MFQIQIQHIRIDGIRESADAADTAKVGGEDKFRIDPAVIQRLFSNTVPCQRQGTILDIITGDGEHPLAQGKCLLHSVELDCLLQNLGITGTLQLQSASLRLQILLQLTPDSCMVINLAVVNNDRPAGVRQHRLRTVCRQIKDRQPLMSQRADAVR